MMNINQIIHSDLHISKSLNEHSTNSAEHIAPIRFDVENGTLILKGKVTKKDLHHYYFPIKSQLAMHMGKGKELIIGIFFSDLDFLNVKVLFELFSYMQIHLLSGAKVKVKWFVSPFDAFILEIAQDFEQLFEVGIETVSTRVQY